MQKVLDRLNELNELNEIYYELIDTKNELIQNAELIIDDLDELNEKVTPDLQDFRIQDNIEVEYNFESFNSNYNNFCIVKQTEEGNIQEKLDENINISTKQSEIISDIQGENDIKKYQEKIEDISLIIANKSPRKNSDNVLIDKPSNISKILINKIPTKILNSTPKTPEKAHKKRPSLEIILPNNPATDSKILHSYATTPSAPDNIVFSLPTGKNSTLSNSNTRSQLTSSSKFNPDSSFFSCEENFFSVPTTNINMSLKNPTAFNMYASRNPSLSSSNKTLIPNPNILSLDKIVFIKNQLKNEIANFTGYTIGDEGAKKISELLLSSQIKNSPSKRTQICKVKELKFTKSNIGDEGFSHLSNCLEKSNSIHSIVLNKNKIKDESYSNILNLIKNNKQLKFLNLSFNQFSQVVKEKIKNISKNLNPNLKLEI